MSNAGAIRLGRSFIEIGADPKNLYRALKQVEERMKTVGKNLSIAGAKIGAVGAAATVPFAAAVRSGAKFQDVLLEIQASTGATAKEMGDVTRASMEMSKAMGVGPAAVSESFLELLKAGMPLQKVLDGAGQSAIEFAKVGKMQVAEAAVVMADAMKVFGVDSQVAANAISSAADASSTSIEGIAQAFSMTSAVAGLANQKIEDVSAALGILANSGVKGSDAGTSLKTMLMRLMAPADDAVKALTDIGLSVESFRGADQKMLPLVQIIDTLNRSMASMDQTAKDDVLRRIFGADAIRAAAILQKEGVLGINGMRKAMDEAMPIGEKFQVLMSGLSGSGSKMTAALERLAVQVTEALAPALERAMPSIVSAIDNITQWAKANGESVAWMAAAAVGAVALGGTLAALGATISLVATGIGAIATIGAALATPIVAAVALVGAAFVALNTDIGKTAAKWISEQEIIKSSIGPWVVFIQNAFTAMGVNLAVAWEQTWNGLADVFRGFMNVMDEQIASVQIQFERMTSLSRHGLENRVTGIKEQTASNRAERSEASQASADRVAELIANGDKLMASRLAALPAAVPSSRPGAPIGEMGPALPPGIGTNADMRNQAEMLVDALKQEAPGRIAEPQAARRQFEVMGSFSAFAAGGMGVGGTLAQETLDVQKDILGAIRDGNKVQE